MSDLFYFEFNGKMYRLSFVITKMDIYLIIDKPITCFQNLYLAVFQFH